MRGGIAAMGGFNEVTRYVGNQYQLFGIRDMTLNSGREKGVRIFAVKNGSGLEFEVVADKALDIADFRYKGAGCCYLSNPGIVNPQYYVEDGRDGFDRNFSGGMLVTCGYTHMGAPSVDNGRKLGLHGPLPATPAEEVSARVEYREGDPEVVILGRMRQAQLSAEHIMSERRITCKYMENKIVIDDRVCNVGFETQPLMMLYHFNFGYPLLSPHARLVIPEKSYAPRDAVTEAGSENRLRFEPPGDGRKEECHFYEFFSEPNGATAALVKNEMLGFSVLLRFNVKQLAYITEWKSMTSGDYALGINPGTYTPMGRVHAKEHNLLQYIEPGETCPFRFELEILETEAAVSQAEQYIASLKH
ncbi:MAG TPA: hypothetical protein DEB31_04955 [Clostridiales bacterium]|nr:hypothetical protein [Clostridiales bacterium]